eukprot:GEMP01017129.1.p1 GENE.GEMP01017129.1~~GEMP01017129.1.p1  ORF type:complete len:167 (-),score=21.81 GEMP01017129.1:876-1376(-)
MYLSIFAKATTSRSTAWLLFLNRSEMIINSLSRPKQAIASSTCSSYSPRRNTSSRERGPLSYFQNCAPRAILPKMVSLAPQAIYRIPQQYNAHRITALLHRRGHWMHDAECTTRSFVAHAIVGGTVFASICCVFALIVNENALSLQGAVSLALLWVAALGFTWSQY